LYYSLSVLFHAGLDEAVRVKGLAILEHEIDGDTEFMCDDAFGSSGAMFGFQALIISTDLQRRFLRFEDDFAKGPFEKGIANFLIAAPVALAR
jgi:hypothetical protein